MIYSRWRPATGGYDYFSAPGRDIPLGNDLPIPSISGGTDIGVASVEIGRPIPSGASHIGSGPDAKGMIAPTVGRSAFGALGAIADLFPATYLYAAGGVILGWFLSRRAK